MYVYSEVGHIIISGIYSQGTVDRIAVLMQRDGVKINISYTALRTWDRCAKRRATGKSERVMRDADSQCQTRHF